MSVIVSNSTLRTMYKKQYELQLYMEEKRGLKHPPEYDADYIEHEHVLAAIYFAACVNIEWHELEDVYRQYLTMQAEGVDSESLSIVRVKALEELIDVWHFVLSVFIFLGLKEDQVGKLQFFHLGDLNSLAEYAGETAVAISTVIADAPYKTWKDQDNTRQLDEEYKKELFIQFAVCFNSILDFAENCLDSSYDEFVKVYLIKNALNFKRQEDKSLGYIRD